MKVVIMDDEAPVLRLLRRVLATFIDVKIVGEYTNSIEGLRAMQAQPPDVCFLDIEMPECNGIEVAKALMDSGIQVVFVTAYEQYALQAFKVNAVDYILKPISNEEVARVLQKLRVRNNGEKEMPAVSPLVISFFGQFTVNYQDQQLIWPMEKVEDLFAYFVYHTGKKIEKWQLCDIFWPNLPSEKAMHSLYNAIYLLKRLLNQYEIVYNISNKRGFYEFTVAHMDIDFERIEKLIDENKDTPSIQVLEQMEALYEGDFLERKDYSWCQPVRAYYEQTYNKWVQQLLDDYIQHNLDEKAIFLGRKVLQLYPEQEQIASLLMPLYLKQGKAALRKFYREYEEHFMQEFHSPLSASVTEHYKKLLKSLQPTR